jgi:DNA-directed RNA polymerase specialized sigma24 family protein
MTDPWFDGTAERVVRPYAMTRGRTRSSAKDTKLDLIALVIAVDATPGEGEPEADSAVEDELLSTHALVPEHLDIVGLCRHAALSVAELATELDLPVGVVRVLIGDLVEAELVRVTRPVPPAELPDESILREVINGLRAL